jgi:hypothetical protein
VEGIGFVSHCLTNCWAEIPDAVWDFGVGTCRRPQCRRDSKARFEKLFAEDVCNI